MALQLLSLFEPVTVEEKCTQGWCSVGQEGRQSVVLCWERVLGMCVREVVLCWEGGYCFGE